MNVRGRVYIFAILAGEGRRTRPAPEVVNCTVESTFPATILHVTQNMTVSICLRRDSSAKGNRLVPTVRDLRQGRVPLVGGEDRRKILIYKTPNEEL